MDAQRIVGGATAGLFLLALLIIGGVVATNDTAIDPPPVADAEEPARRPGGTVPVAAPAAGPMARRPIPSPTGAKAARPPSNSPAADLSTEEWRDYNSAMHDVVSKAREACIRPYAQEQGLGKIEVIVDAVLWDGQVVDFGLRGLQEVPDHVLDCVGEIAWNSPFPSHDVPGEVRLQRNLEVDGRRRTNGDNP